MDNGSYTVLQQVNIQSDDQCSSWGYCNERARHYIETECHM